MSWWNKYWFAPTYYFDLAVVRIFIATAQLLLIAGLLPNRGVFNYAMLKTELDDVYFEPLPILNLLNLPFGWGTRPDIDMLVIVFYVGIAAAVLSIVGLLTNISLLVLAFSTVYLQSYAYSFGDFHHPEAVMAVALTVLALSPAGRVLSFDAFLRRKRHSQTENEDILTATGEFAGWAIKLMQWFFVLMYLSAVVAKLTTSGWGWANGYTLQYYLLQDGLRFENPFALWFAGQHDLMVLLQNIVLIFQATFALAVLFPKLRWIYVPLGLSFHTGILLTLQAPFYEWIFLYVIFIPWSHAYRTIFVSRDERRRHSPVLQ